MSGRARARSRATARPGSSSISGRTSTRTRSRPASGAPRQAIAATVLRRAGLSPVARRCCGRLGPLPARSRRARRLLKAAAAAPSRARAAARAISTAGGLGLAELDAASCSAGGPGLFAAGEMLDWDAPTGGYLLQACFASGTVAGRGALAHLSQG